MNINIRKATADDHNRIWTIIKPVIAGGESYNSIPDSTLFDTLSLLFPK